MKYVVRLTFNYADTCLSFLSRSRIEPTHIINDRTIAYVFDTTEDAFVFLCFVTKETAFIADNACYIMEDGQKGFR